MPELANSNPAQNHLFLLLLLLLLQWHCHVSVLPHLLRPPLPVPTSRQRPWYPCLPPRPRQLRRPCKIRFQLAGDEAREQEVEDYDMGICYEGELRERAAAVGGVPGVERVGGRGGGRD